MKLKDWLRETKARKRANDYISVIYGTTYYSLYEIEEEIRKNESMGELLIGETRTYYAGKEIEYRCYVG